LLCEVGVLRVAEQEPQEGDRLLVEGHILGGLLGFVELVGFIIFLVYHSFEDDFIKLLPYVVKNAFINDLAFDLACWIAHYLAKGLKVADFEHASEEELLDWLAIVFQKIKNLTDLNMQVDPFSIGAAFNLATLRLEQAEQRRGCRRQVLLERLTLPTGLLYLGLDNILD
jgi:hypothetical protein